MAKEFKLPELGENIESADVLNVLVKAGDKVEKEQSVLEIETDKATIEVPSAVSGVIKEVMVKEGEKIKVGQTVFTVDENGKTPEAPPEEEAKAPVKEEKKGTPEPEKTKKEEPKQEKPAAEAKSSGKIVEMKLPELGENIDSADVLTVLVHEGDYIERDQTVMEIETDKATIEVPSSVVGKVTQVLIKDGDKAKVGQVLLKVDSAETEIKEPAKPASKAAEAPKSEPVQETEVSPKGEIEKMLPGERDHQPPISRGAAPAAPSVRRIARELGVDIKKVPGTGPSGRISMDDVKLYVKNMNESRAGQPAFGVKQEPLPDFSKFGSVDRKPMSNIRSKTAQHMTYAWSTIPSVTQHDKADITELESVRKLFNPRVEKAGGKLTVTSILLKIIASALKVFPQFNSSIDLEKKEVIYKKYYNIGVAVDTEHGLIVPVIKDVDKKNIAELSVELNTIADKARIRKISLEELQGGSFTITNLGGIGGTSFTPIINSPEVAILGVSRGKFEPVYKDGQFEPRLMLPLSLSYDHRIIDGADAARFARWVCEALEQPMKILVEG